MDDICIYQGGKGMKVELFDTVILKDGREAAIVEKYSETDFMADVGSSPKDWDTISITIEDIKEVVK